jgi:ankyrin repeat protein
VGDQNGDTSLHAAAIANGVEVLSFLLQCEANPDTANYAGLTPCHLARSRDALVVLCDAGAMPYCVDTKSRMPLWFACNEGRSDCAEFLCSKTPAAYLLWPDEEGETCLHRAAMGGHAQCVEALAAQLPGVEDLYTVNKKQHTAAHVASSAAVLKALYENGANLWMADPKGRMPLFTASFFGRADCIAFLLDVASNNSSNSSSGKKSTTKGAGDAPAVVSAADFQGDTALHVACLCGHLRCVGLLLYFARCAKNRQGLTPDQLATKAGHTQIAQLVAHIEAKKEKEGLSSQEIFGCDFSMLSAVTLYYGARWAKLYDVSFDTVYYLDRATGQSQWERPEAYDEPAAEESRCDKARAVLHRFYSQHNPERLGSMNDILAAYRGRYTELFISLANKYNVQDLSMFAGVDLE